MNALDLLSAEMHPALKAFPLDRVTADLLPAIRSTALRRVPPAPGVERIQRTVPKTDPAVPVRIHRSADAAHARPAVIALHGGGFVMGTAEMHDVEFNRWCAELDVVGIAVEYRLAPEAPYPAALDDCYAVLLWVHANAERLGIDTSMVGVYGSSAGGGLAAGLALLARDRGEASLAFQVLEYPMLDDRQLTQSSQLEGLPIWSRESNAFGWQSYLGSLYGSDDVPCYAAPGRATDLRGLPPAYVCVGAVDGFRDEDVHYALALADAGVPTELHMYAGAPHGYQLAGETATNRLAVRNLDDWLARQLGPTLIG